MVYVESHLPSPGHDSEDTKSIWLASIAEGRKPEETALIRTALEIADRAHLTQTRASGEPYLNHAMAVADIADVRRMTNSSIRPKTYPSEATAQYIIGGFCKRTWPLK